MPQADLQKDAYEDMRLELERLEMSWNDLKRKKSYDPEMGYERMKEKVEAEMKEANASLEQLHRAGALNFDDAKRALRKDLGELESEIDRAWREHPPKRSPR